MLDALVTFVRRFVALTDSQARVWALWVIHTHLFETAEQTPYLWITSPEKRSGKSRLLEVSELFVARPWLTGRVSAAALVRKVDKERPALLLDESDAAFNGEKDYAEALRGILNTGHRKSGRASHCVGVGTAMDVRNFSTFCPKAIAGIGRLPDTVADRAIPIRLRRKARSESVERFRERLAREEADPIREAVEAWARSAASVLADARPSLPEELSDRAQDGAEPLLAIADLAATDWPKSARSALVELFGGDRAEEESLGVRLLSDCRTVFAARGADRLGSADLCGFLVAIADSPWPEFHKGRPLTVRGLARLLNPFEIVPGTIRLDDGSTPKGYYRLSFEDAWTRYCPEQPPRNATAPHANTGAGFHDSPKRHTEDPVAGEKPGIVNTRASCGDVEDGEARARGPGESPLANSARQSG
jgi:hypothetical protein